MLRELDRISIRLGSLNLDRIARMEQPVHDCARVISESSKGGAQELPRVGPSAYVAQITVVTQDLLMMNPEGNEVAAKALTELRRALP